MKISAHVHNREGEHQVSVSTDGQARSVVLPAKTDGPGSGVNGGELLFLALATCYCNDVYREAAARGIKVTQVEVEVEGEFGTPGAAARNIRYRARVTAKASQAEIRALMAHTDRVAEIQYTLRTGTPVTLSVIEAVCA